MSKCINCGEEITDPKRRKYCSHSCYLIDNSRNKYRNGKIRSIALCNVWGISLKQLYTYGKHFLEENPAVIDILKEINTNSDLVDDCAKEESKIEKRLYMREYIKKNKDACSVRSKQWKEENPEKHKEYSKEYAKEYYKKNKEKRNEYAKKRKEENPEKYKEYAKEYAKEYYKKNKEKMNESTKKWKEENPEKHKEYTKEYAKEYYKKNKLNKN